MDKLSLVNKVNADLLPIVGYNPYFHKDGKIICSCCHKQMLDENEGSLTSTKEVPNVNGDFEKVHKCPGCKYLQGINVAMKKRFTDLRKAIDFHEYNSPETPKFKNQYFKPQAKYRFVIPDTSEVIEITEEELVKGYDDMMYNLINNSTKVERNVILDDDVKDEVSTESAAVVVQEHVPVAPVVAEPIEVQQTIVEEIIAIEDRVEERIIEEEEAAPADEIVEEDESDKLFDDEENLDDIFGEDETVVEEEDVISDEIVEEEIIDINDQDGTFEDDNLEDFFDVKEEQDVIDPIEDIITNNNTRPSGIGSIHVEKDPVMEQMFKDNKESEENDLFKVQDRKEPVFNIVRRSRINDLKESFNDSNAKVVLDRILKLFERRANRTIKYKVTINDLTHECPVIDFESNIRLIFVDLDSYQGGQYNIETEVNNKLASEFTDTSEYDIMSYVVFSDQIEGRNINRVVRAVAKNIAFNLKIKGVFNTIVITDDSDSYFYTTSDYDKKDIERFDFENCASNVDKPNNGEIALVSRWINPNYDEMSIYRKEISNRAILSRGGTVNYDDLSMFMTCSLKYIMLPQQPDGSINVTIVDYIESLDLFIRDGFGALVGVLIHNIKTQYPQSKLHLYFELDVSTIPSPTLSRYIKSGSIRPIDVNPDIENFNNIIEVISRQNGATVPTIPVEGAPFDSLEYNNNYWRSYVLAPEFRRNPTDSKRVDWRRFGKKSFAKTLGERFKEYKNVNVSDRKARQALLEQLGYYTVIQPQIIKAKVTDEFGIKALSKVMQTCSGVFSISQYTKMNRSHVVDDSYSAANAGNYYGSNMGLTPDQMQQMMYQQQMQQMANAYQQQYGYNK